ncbi:S-adenosyl-L-methionine-dependent methyltransferase [Lophium mytilinum]|uniref:tRNA (adenine(58)-N(1))-methyltransferase catalytic subunit TRM61 n=1 Tax=Lophium mytilinum TaxID=390894 RepID=A0A6A6RC99_9PEZI|nr:S-adenosyl-L-methionine-dependent methyltransferase [Lophium mytilinum]
MSINTGRGEVPHSNIIGKRIRDIVLAKKGHEFRVYEPTLAEYVRLTPRVVTPIYPSDANIIVSLLDIHVTPPSGSNEDAPPLEILEAGTGHGALTLHLSRAIHAANPALPNLQSTSTGLREGEDPEKLAESIVESNNASLEAWKQQRRAVVHTLDISKEFQSHARKVVRNFRKGIYAGNVDFHVGDVSAWVASEMKARNTTEPFLSHIFLDLPSADSHLANVAPALHVDGILAVFNPSITQIAECVEIIRTQKLPYVLDQVVELGATATMRQWDVRSVRPRSVFKKAALSQASETSEASSDEASQDEAVEGHASRDGELEDNMAKTKSDYAMVCRPKVGERVVGGGFLGLWRRMRSSGEE